MEFIWVGGVVVVVGGINNASWVRVDLSVCAWGPFLLLPLHNENGRGLGNVQLRAVGQWDMSEGEWEGEGGRRREGCYPKLKDKVQQGEAVDESVVEIQTCGWTSVLSSDEHYAEPQD